VACALAMGSALERLNATWDQASGPRLANGIGIASGPAVVGQIGSPKRMEFTVIGDTVNRAARLESLTRQLGAPVLMDRPTAERLAESSQGLGSSAGPHSPWLPAVPRGVHPMKGLGDVEVFSPPEGAAGSACAGPGR
jgi:adenylate cyclase